MTTKNSETLAFRVAPADLVRLEAVRRGLPIRASRSAVAREALKRGLDELAKSIELSPSRSADGGKGA